LCKRRFFVRRIIIGRVHVCATVCNVDPSWRHQQRMKKFNLRYIACVSIVNYHFPPSRSTVFFSIAAAMTWHSSHKNRPLYLKRRHSILRWRIACVCHHVSLNYIFSSSPLFLCAEKSEPHMLFFRWLHFECGRYRIPIFFSYSSELACVRICVQITRLIWCVERVGRRC
jgi:hypothetical protein